MRTIKAEPLTRETFAPFGTFYSMTEPEGYSLNGEIHRFFPDRIAETYTTRIGFSPILVKKPEEMKVTQVEYHTTTPEMILPLNDDMILHVAPASGCNRVYKGVCCAERNAGKDFYSYLAFSASSCT